MTAKWKMFLVHTAIFIAVFLITRAITIYIMQEASMVTTMIPIVCAVLFAPKPHIVNTQAGKQYGIKSIFSKKVIWF